MVTLTQQQQQATAVLGSLATCVWIENGAVLAQVEAGRIAAALKLVRDDERTQLDILSFMTAVDHTPREPRFTLVYELYSTQLHGRLRLKCELADTGSEVDLPEIDSVSGVYLTAAWHERECYDLMGIRFRHHPDLRRILLPAQWDGHPLRKEYPYDGKRVWKAGCTVIDSAHMAGDLGL